MKLATCVMTSVLSVGCAADLREDSRGDVDAATDADASPTGDSPVSSSDNGDGTSTTRIDATAAGAWVYFSFAAGHVDPAGGTHWDMAFQRFKIKLNGGASGSAGVEIALLPDASLDAGAAPAGGYLSDEPDADGDGEPEYAFLTVGEGWYAYDPVTHVLAPRPHAYAVRAATGAYYKLRLVDYYDEAGTGGYPAFRWRAVEAPAAAREVR